MAPAAPDQVIIEQSLAVDGDAKAPVSLYLGVSGRSGGDWSWERERVGLKKLDWAEGVPAINRSTDIYSRGNTTVVLEREGRARRKGERRKWERRKEKDSSIYYSVNGNEECDTAQY